MNITIKKFIMVGILYFCSSSFALEAPPNTQLSNAHLSIWNQAFNSKEQEILTLLESANINTSNIAYINSLVLSHSPYLLRHSVNPINWYEWQDKVLDIAQIENKLIFLSIGYSTCHWCHVMEKDSFVDLDVAGVLNQSYLSIKVDRELNTELDQHFSSVLAALKGTAGWPVTAILTPNGQPIWMDVFVDKGRLIKTLNRLQAIWRTQPRSLQQIAKNISLSTQSTSISMPDIEWSETILRNQLMQWRSYLDSESGGLKGSPKFLESPLLTLLLLEYQHNQSPELKTILITWLDNLYQSPIRDQVLGGFHRYASDANWQSPHFEKMLYNQAQLISVYVLAARTLDNPEYFSVARDTLLFTEKYLGALDGDFYAAIDADYTGLEGGFYTFSDLQKRTLEQSGETLWKKVDERWLPSQLTISNEIQRKAYATERLKRPLPHTDKKLITGWNGLMLSAYSELFEYTGNDAYLIKAEKLANTILTKNMAVNGLAKAVYMDNATGKADLADYAYLSEGLLKLFNITNNRYYLNEARGLADTAFKRIEVNNTLGTIKDEEIPSALVKLFDSYEYIQKLQLTPLAQVKKLRNKIRAAYSQDSDRGFEATRVLLKYTKHGAYRHFARGQGTIAFECDDEQVQLNFSLNSGWHINSNKKRIASLIPLRVSALMEGSMLKVNYPKATEKSLSFDDEKLSLFSGEFKVGLVGLKVNKNIVVSLQACNETTCLLPEKIMLSTPLNCFKTESLK